jgi:DNA-binding NtrC family response regulator
MKTTALASFVTADPTLNAVIQTVHQVADTDATVLITGETGTGKELIARALHEESSRRAKNFVPVNCGALPETLLESELFGHIRGAFTGATETRPGKFELAEGGTVFLDEIADMNHALQVKLLRVLQTGDYSPVGSAAVRQCRARVVAASNQSLKPLVASGVVRADLYYRLNVICLDLPPLRARRDDIARLSEFFLKQFAATYGRQAQRFHPEVISFLNAYNFPGNVRELENIVRRAVILTRSPEITLSDLPAEVRQFVLPYVDEAPAPASFHTARACAVREFEREFLIGVLRECGGIISRAARRAGLSERNLHAKLKKYGLHGRDFRVPAARAV